MKEGLESYRLVSLAREGVTESHPAAISSAFEGQEKDCRTLVGGKRRCLYVDFSKAFAGVDRITESQNCRGWKAPLWVI